MKKNIKISGIIVLALIIIPLSSKAFSFDEFFSDFDKLLSNLNDNAQITNKVNVQTNTGGNVVNDGEVTEGQSKSEVHINNIINGQEIDPVDIESNENEVKVKSEINATDDKATIQREIQTGSDKKTENYEVNLESTQNQEENNVFQEWVSNLLADMESFFRKIFNLI